LSDFSLDWGSIAMGPKLRAFVGIPAETYQGTKDPGPEFPAALVEYAVQRGIRDEAELSDLIDELVTMDQPRAALGLAARFPAQVDAGDFRTQLSLGVAGMLAGDHDTAETAFRAAQGVLPDEPAPYVNLVQILMHQERHEEAEIWAEAGLDADRNNTRLWELVARLLSTAFGDYVGAEVERRATKRDAWAGLALAADLTTTGDRYYKLTLLERLYPQGEREPGFLVELTAAYGVAGDYAKIPQVVWQAERLSQKGLPWQLHVHVAQAQVALGKYAEAMHAIAKARRAEHAPEGLHAMLDELERECADADAEKNLH
jgi:tetratricopeptide (TPR) repeat protein